MSKHWSWGPIERKQNPKFQYVEDTITTVGGVEAFNFVCGALLALCGLVVAGGLLFLLVCFPGVVLGSLAVATLCGFISWHVQKPRATEEA